MQISNKVVVISGASGGLGELTAKAMAKAGASLVVLLGRNQESLDRVAQEIRLGGGAARSYAVDLSRPEEASAVAQKIMNEVGVPDILINNAGSGQWKFLTDTSVDEIQQMMAVPYFAAAVLTREFLPGMLKRNSGHIVTISSVISRFVWPGATAYAAARWAIRGFTEALRADLYGTDIGVTFLESGVFASTYWDNNPGSLDHMPKMGRLIPPLAPEWVAGKLVAGIKCNKKHIVLPFMMKVVYFQHFFFPGFVQWLMTVTGKRINRRYVNIKKVVT